MNYMAWKPSKDAANYDGEAEADAPGSEIKRGGIIAGLFFVGLLGLAAFVPLDSGAYGEGVVAVSGSRQAVQHREGGIVTSLHVTEGQTVTKGEELLRGFRLRDRRDRARADRRSRRPARLASSASGRARPAGASFATDRIQVHVSRRSRSGRQRSAGSTAAV